MSNKSEKDGPRLWVLGDTALTPEEVLEILRKEWNGMGVSGLPSDEYETYVPAVLDLLLTNAPVGVIAKALNKIERTMFGIAPDVTRAVHVARILRLRESRAHKERNKAQKSKAQLAIEKARRVSVVGKEVEEAIEAGREEGQQEAFAEKRNAALAKEFESQLERATYEAKQRASAIRKELGRVLMPWGAIKSGDVYLHGEGDERVLYMVVAVEIYGATEGLAELQPYLTLRRLDPVCGVQEERMAARDFLNMFPKVSPAEAFEASKRATKASG